MDRRKFFKTCFYTGTAAATGLAIDGWAIEPHWVEVVRTEIPIANLPDEFEGKTIAHISDLHLSNVVSKEYLIKCADRIRTLEADMTVITGDFITSGWTMKHIDDFEAMLPHFASPLGVYACLGNHDYAFYSLHRRREINRSQSQQSLDKHWKILNNETAKINIDGKSIYVAGVGDYWSNNCQIEDTMKQIPASQASIVLSHNPDSVQEISQYNPSVILCGHTHGGQVRLPLIGPLVLPTHNRDYDAGQFDVNGCFVYVNRGLGVLPGIFGRVRLNCRPEITLHTLRKA